MRIILKNLTNELITFRDVGISLLPLSEEIFDIRSSAISVSDEVITAIANNRIIVNNLVNDLSAIDGIKYLISGLETLPKTHDGKLYVHSTGKLLGLYVYWTGRGDNLTNGFVGNGEPILMEHKIGDPRSQHKYIDFMCLDNRTQLIEGTVLWRDTEFGDTGSCLMTTSAFPTVPGTNTTFRKHGPIVVPAAGDGDVELAGDPSNIDPALGCLVAINVDEMNIRQPGFWNANYNPETKKFENLTPVPNGDGEYNIFHEEYVIGRFVNHINFLGNGSKNLNNNDPTNIVHGYRLKFHIDTSDYVPDHNWKCSIVLTLLRKKTY